MIDKEAVTELQELMVKHYGKTVADEQAVHIGEKLIELIRVVGRPVPQTIDTSEAHGNNKGAA